MSSDTHSLLSRVKALTELQLKQARSRDWHALAQLDTERRALLEAIGNGAEARPANARLKALGQEVLELDRQLLALVRDERAALARQSQKSHAQQSAYRDYRKAQRLVQRMPGE